jgi:hypothetical protein
VDVVFVPKIKFMDFIFSTYVSLGSKSSRKLQDSRQMSNCFPCLIFIGFLISWISLPTKTGTPRMKVISEYTTYNQRPTRTCITHLVTNIFFIIKSLFMYMVRSISIVVSKKICLKGFPIRVLYQICHVVSISWIIQCNKIKAL